MLLVLTRRIRAFGQVTLSLLLALSVQLVTLTFTSTSTASSGGMSCCPNGSSTHCNSGMMQAVAKPEAKPACHHESVIETDPDTIVAEPSRHHAHSSSSVNSSGQAASPSVRAPCATDCCSLGPSTFKRPNRQSIELIRRTIANKPLLYGSDCDTSLVLLYPRSFSKPIPRGPPSGTTF